MGFFDNFSFEWSFGKKRNDIQNQDIPAQKDESIVPAVSEEVIQEIVKKVQSSFVSSNEVNALPAVGGRLSVVEGVNQLNSGIAFNVQEDYPFKILEILENLSIMNGHVSYAVENVVSLAHTDKEIYFADTVKDPMAQKMKQHIKTVQSRWYDFSTGEDGLINDLFAQLATFGCLSVEDIPTNDLSGIKKVVRVSPYNIRFAYDKKADEFLPLQVSPLVTKGNFPGYVELNPTTYKYIALKRYKTTPYPVPPFVSALEDLITEKDMKGNFKTIMKKLGMLGFLSALVTAPKQKAGEDSDAYQERTRTYLESLRPQLENGFARGMTIGYKESHLFELQGTNINADAGEKLMKMVKMAIYSGLKQDPNMHGENYSTTETFGRVILAKMSKQAENYQKVVETYLENLYFTELILAGFNPGYVEVKFLKPMIGDVKRDAETEKINIENVKAKYDMGIISQLGVAQELGYDKPDQEEPRKSPEAAADVKDEPTGKEPEMKVAASKEREDVQFVIGLSLYGLDEHETPFDYFVPGSCGITSFDSDADYKDSKLEGYIKKYSGAVYKQFKKAIKAALPGIKKDIKKLDAGASAVELTEVVFYHLFKDWNVNFKKPIQGDINNNITSAYRTYRKDKKIFSGAIKKRGMAFDDFVVPDPVFELLDYRAIEYLQNLDSLYLGKFITDEDTRERIKSWISEQYLTENNPIGKNSEMMDKFTEAFADKVSMESWKIRRVIETTLNKTRNFANVNYINQAEVEEFEIVEVLDQKTCDWCTHMNGKTFSVTTAVDKIEKVVNGKPTEVTKLSPFATTIPLDDFRKMDAATLQAKGIDTPSYHCHCRGRVVAVI